MDRSRRIIEGYLAESAGIRIRSDFDEKRPCDIVLNDSRFFKQVFARGSMGLGESYMRGYWDCLALDEFFYHLIKSLNHGRNRQWYMPFIFSGLGVRQLWWHFRSKMRRDPYYIGEHHYDTGNLLFELMLGDTMAYSCGYWRQAETLDEAQNAKYDLICRKLDLQPGMRILDIGCGWGSFAAYAAKFYKVEVVGITVSQKQVDFAQKKYRQLPVLIKLQDYRLVEGIFDRIVSIGMFEHVGKKHYKDFFAAVSRCLADDGVFLLHTIGSNRPVVFNDPWIDKYIFPGGYIPSASQIMPQAQSYFVMEDWHNFGLDYDKTLMAWYKNFKMNWIKISGLYSDEFYRMWEYYLLSCAGLFRARGKQLWQIVFRKSQAKGTYVTAR